MVHRTDTRRRMLDTAAELFHTQGYHATGLNQLLTAGGAPKGSLYFHFPGGKEQLAAEAIEISSERLREGLKAIAEHASGPADAVGLIIDALAQALAASDFHRGCPIATVALDASDDSEQIRLACSGGYLSWQETVAEYLATQGVEDAEALATVIIASIEGGLLLAKTQHDLAPLHAIGAHLRAILEPRSSRSGQ
jgi:TetR/AcrR family transcriptional repressor of lmrAB and yxaGH operons